MAKELIQTFLPWILFFIFVGHNLHQLELAVLLAAVTSILFEYKRLKLGFILSWGTVLFFVFMFVAVVLFKNEWIATHTWLFSDSALAAIAWISIFLRKPFTMQYAKLEVSSDKWQHPLFLKINYILTIFWGMIFLCNLALHMINANQIISWLLPILAIWFTRWFPNWYREKHYSPE